LRRLFKGAESGLTRSALDWGARHGAHTRIQHGVYGEGPEPPSALDRARARVIARDDVAAGNLAGVLLGLDSVELDTRPVRRRLLPPERIIEVEGMRCADGVQTMLDLAETLDDLAWEQALESALRKGLAAVGAIAANGHRCRGAARIQRVLALRPPGAPPTESLLETLMVQLIRVTPGVPEPTRQHVVYDGYGNFVARVDLSWPELGVFIELDGQRHAGQPVYDAARQTAVTAATGWLCGRFTWKEVTRLKPHTARRLDRKSVV